jgi:carbon-monoxide dehydrogenase small subunit
MATHQISFTLNGVSQAALVESHLTLLSFLREGLGLTGTKNGCATGECGACTVLLDGEPVNACLVLAVEVDGGSILTIEGLAVEGQLDPLQQAFVEHTGTQCGFCTPGILIAAHALLDRIPDPDEAAIKDALRGNLCRCTGYTRIIDAVKQAAQAGG